MAAKERILASQKVFLIPETEYFMENEIEEMVQKLRTHLSKELLVPLICEDMYEFVNSTTNEVQSLHEYIVEQVISRCRNRILLSESELDDILSKGYYGMELLQDKIGDTLYEDIYLSIINEGKTLKPGVRLKPQVKEFLEACQFPLIITTNCFPIIELELKNYSSEFFIPESKNKTRIKPKCVYHIFGEAMPNNENWGYNERLILKFLKYAYSTEYSFTNLSSYIAGNNLKKTLLILGNDSPNWLFRFILSPIYPGDVYDNGNGFYIQDVNRKEDKGLNHFLRMIHFSKDNNLMEILETITSRIGRANLQVERNDEKEFNVFISHASEDNEAVKVLIGCLAAHGIRVWIDNEGINEGQYWNRIIEGMQNSRFFMPFITEAYINKTKSHKEQQKALQELGITELLFDARQTHDIDCKLGGVATELLLAERIFSGDLSLPVIRANSTYFDEPLTSKRIDNWGKDSKRLPEKLFYGVKMFEFDDDKPQEFILDWNRYV